MQYNGVLYKDSEGQKTSAMMIKGVPDPTTPPTLSSVSNPSTGLTAGNYYVKYTWVTAEGETKPSPEAATTLSAQQDLVVTLPTFPSGVTQANIYISTTSGAETKQGSTSTTTYTQSAALVAGAALPTDNTTYRWTTQVTRVNSQGAEIIASMGTHGNAWNNASVSANGESAVVDTQNTSRITIFGNASAATTLTIKWSQNGTNFYGNEQIVLGSAGDFVLHVQSGARYVKLASSAAATITATIAGKA